MSEEPLEQHEDYSGADDQATNRVLWERGSSLKDVFEARLAELPDDLALRDLLRPGPYAVWRREQVEQNMRDDLVRAKLTALTRFEAEVPQYDCVAESYWPGSQLNVLQNSADGRNGRVDEIRLLQDKTAQEGGAANCVLPKAALEVSWSEAKREKVILRVFQKEPLAHFRTRKEFQQLCLEEAGSAGKVGFGRTKLHETRKRLEEEGKIPSRSDQ